MKQYTIEEIDQHIEPLEIALRGWKENHTNYSETFTQEKGNETIRGLEQELKFWECQKALINPDFIEEFPLNKEQCIKFITEFSAVKKELLTDK